MLNSDEIIKAFDSVVKFFWGAPREYVNRHDKKHAEEWIASGVTIEVCYIVFTRKLGDLFFDEEDVPTSIGYLRESVLEGLDRMNGKVTDEWEKDISRWRARVRVFAEKGQWLPDWGDLPAENPLVPNSVLKEFKIDRAAARASK